MYMSAVSIEAIDRLLSKDIWIRVARRFMEKDELIGAVLGLQKASLSRAAPLDLEERIRQLCNLLIPEAF